MKLISSYVWHVSQILKYTMKFFPQPNKKKTHTHRHNEINACKGMTTNFFFHKLHIYPIDHELVTLPSTLGESILCFGNTNSASVLVFSTQ